MKETKLRIGVACLSGSTVSHSLVSWIKRRIWRGCDTTHLDGDEFGCHAGDGDIGPPAGSRQCLLVLAVVILALAVMMLILLLNYQCTVEWQLCKGIGEYLPKGW